MKRLFVLMAVSMLWASCGGNANRQAEGERTATPVKLTKAEFLEKVHNFEADAAAWKYLGDKPAIVDFYADWCGPCRTIAPILEELAAEYAGQIYVYKVDVDKERELTEHFGIRSIPMLLFIPLNGQPQTVSGTITKAEFEEMIKQMLAPSAD